MHQWLRRFEDSTLNPSQQVIHEILFFVRLYLNYSLSLYKNDFNVLKTDLGYNISYQELIHPHATQIVVIASATGVVKEFYKHFSAYLFENGISVVTFDYGGIGKSKPITLRNFKTSATKWATNDFEAVLSHVKRNYGHKKLILIGHSIGGQLIGLTPSALDAEKILLVGAQSGYYKLWSFRERVKMLFAWKVLFPLFDSALGYIPTKKFTPMEDLPGGMAMEWSKWCLSPGYLFDHVEGDKLLFDKFKSPVYSFSTDRDKFATIQAIDWLSDRYVNADVNRIHLKPEEYGVKNIGHFGYFQKKCSHSVWPVLLEKIKS